MYHLLVDHSSEATKTMKRSSEKKTDMKYWFDRIMRFEPDSITLWDGPILLDYYVGNKEQK